MPIVTQVPQALPLNSSLIFELRNRLFHRCSQFHYILVISVAPLAEDKTSNTRNPLLHFELLANGVQQTPSKHYRVLLVITPPPELDIKILLLKEPHTYIIIKHAKSIQYSVGSLILTDQCWQVLEILPEETNNHQACLAVNSLRYNNHLPEKMYSLVQFGIDVMEVTKHILKDRFNVPSMR